VLHVGHGQHLVDSGNTEPVKNIRHKGLESHLQGEALLEIGATQMTGKWTPPSQKIKN
jgi:hypothetical protein